MSDRIEQLRSWLDGQRADAYLVTSGINVGYLTGFSSSSAALLVSADTVHLFTDGRYADAAREVEQAEPIILERNLLGEIGRVLADYASGPVSFEAAHVSFSGYEQLAKTSVELIPSNGVIERQRSVKDAAELAAVRAAAAVLSTALERVPALNPVGRTERELAWLLERMMREELGADALSFPTIVASGPNSARPHHAPGGRVISPDEILLIDSGCVVDGYCSDCTRVYATGALPEELAVAYQVCLEVQQSALESVHAGADTKALDDEHREALTSRGYSVDHSLGHGVGLEIHEEPRLAPTVSSTLTVGQVVTVEPGIYLPDIGGVRIEDMMLVTGEIGDVLTSVTKELVRVD